MTEYHYVGTTAEGKTCHGSVRAPHAEAARLRLISQGITPMRLGESAQDIPGAATAASPGGARAYTLKRADILLFSREMAHLKQANMPLDKALAMLRETAATPQSGTFITKVQEGVRAGKSLYQSLLPFEKELGRQYLMLIRAGEASGALHVILKELVAQLEAEDKLRNYVISCMTYPLILLVVAVLSMIMLLAFVVPQFRDIFDSMGDALPYYTRLVLALSDFLRQYWMALLAALAAVLWLAARWLATPAGRLRLDGALLNVPLMGKVLRNLQLAIYLRTFGVLVQRGVPMVDALRIAIDTLSNTVLHRDMEPLVAQVKAGQRLSAGFTGAHFAKTSTPQLIRVAEETGQLDATLLGLADRYEDEGRRIMGRVLAALEPLIIIVLGMMVAFIIVAILGGVLSINDTI